MTGYYFYFSLVQFLFRSNDSVGVPFVLLVYGPDDCLLTSFKHILLELVASVALRDAVSHRMAKILIPICSRRLFWLQKFIAGLFNSIFGGRRCLSERRFYSYYY